MPCECPAFPWDVEDDPDNKYCTGYTHEYRYTEVYESSDSKEEVEPDTQAVAE